MWHMSTSVLGVPHCSGAPLLRPGYYEGGETAQIRAIRPDLTFETGFTHHAMRYFFVSRRDDAMIRGQYVWHMSTSVLGVPHCSGAPALRPGYSEGGGAAQSCAMYQVLSK